MAWGANVCQRLLVGSGLERRVRCRLRGGPPENGRGSIGIGETGIVCEQFSKIPLKTTTFTGVLRATEFPTQSGEFGTWKVRATATTKPAIKRRSAA